MEKSVLFSFSLVSVSFAFLSQKKEKEMEKALPISYLNHEQMRIIYLSSKQKHAAGIVLISDKYKFL